MRTACERRELLGSSMLTAGLALTIAKADEEYAATPAPLSGSCAAPNAPPPITYISFDQLTGAWGADEWLYPSVPWQQGTPERGYQLHFTDRSSGWG